MALYSNIATAVIVCDDEENEEVAYIRPGARQSRQRQCSKVSLDKILGLVVAFLTAATVLGLLLWKYAFSGTTYRFAKDVELTVWDTSATLDLAKFDVHFDTTVKHVTYHSDGPCYLFKFGEVPPVSMNSLHETAENAYKALVAQTADLQSGWRFIQADNVTTFEVNMVEAFSNMTRTLRSDPFYCSKYYILNGSAIPSSSKNESVTCFPIFSILREDVDHIRQVVCHGDTLTHVPYHLSRKTRELVLQNSNITHLPADAFRAYPNLDTIILRQTRLRQIQGYAFRGLPRLEKLIVVENYYLTSLLPFAFADLNGSHYKHVEINQNQIMEIPANTFSNSRHLRVLDLRLNPIRTIRTNAFTQLYHVDFLHMPESLYRIEADAFWRLIRVHVLDIVHWKVNVRTNKFTFRGMRHVNTLSIHHSHLGDVTDNTFSGMHTVKSVHIFNSEMRQLKARSFADLANVHRITMRYCYIDRLEKDMKSLIESGLVVVEQSRVSCQCSNVWLVQLGQKYLKEYVCPDGEYAKKTLWEVRRPWFEMCLKKMRKEERMNDFEKYLNSASVVRFTYFIWYLTMLYLLI